MPNGTDEHPTVRTERVPFKKLKRTNVHRTSEPTDDQIGQVRWEMTVARGGREVIADAVVLAALRIARKNPDDHRAEVERIEAETFQVKLRPGAIDPGE